MTGVQIWHHWLNSMKLFLLGVDDIWCWLSYQITVNSAGPVLAQKSKLKAKHQIHRAELCDCRRENVKLWSNITPGINKDSKLLMQWVFGFLGGVFSADSQVSDVFNVFLCLWSSLFPLWVILVINLIHHVFYQCCSEDKRQHCRLGEWVTKFYLSRLQSRLKCGDCDRLWLHYQWCCIRVTEASGSKQW